MEKLSVLFYTLVAIDFFLVAKQLDFVHGSPPKEAPPVGIYELKKGHMSVKFTNWGASIISLVLPDKYGNMGDITLGYDSVKDYMNDTTYFGGVVGRVANRIGGAKFTLNGTEYKLKANEGKNMLHGGPKGYSDVIWNVTKYKNDNDHPSIRFSYDSHDGEEGQKKYTPVNLAQHTYWNLGNHDSGDILSEKILIFASNYTPVDSELIPTGEIVAVKGTPYDFLEPQTIGSRIKELPNGYDINYALDGSPNEMKRVAIVKDKKSGRVMELSANQPGVQFYTGNMIKDVKGKGGFIYKAHAGLCLETQGYPDSVNHPNFPSQIIAPGKYYTHNMLFKFSIEP
ncbi:Aldose 1-/Glucose-6-phosphate 1-epimerase [Corchorus olitorius]|uniref:Aldose 1-epimerase n=1 Tax=Corchorus olitorius TaxID=93759 RepID=A0A1R3K8L0_9ROSI|nr:Aldose 1-/Glucose-6-phosphate 1-epimerase [Corchorus olitorius]